VIAILGWTDGFGNDTYVDAIYPTLEIAQSHCKDSKAFRWVEFDFGEVEFDWYDANEFRNEKHKSKRRKRKEN